MVYLYSYFDAAALLTLWACEAFLLGPTSPPRGHQLTQYNPAVTPAQPAAWKCSLPFLTAIAVQFPAIVFAVQANPGSAADSNTTML